MYKTKILTRPPGGVDAIHGMVEEINASGDRIVSFQIQHEVPSNRLRSFIFILETPDSNGRFLGE